MWCALETPKCSVFSHRGLVVQRCRRLGRLGKSVASDVLGLLAIVDGLSSSRLVDSLLLRTVMGLIYALSATPNTHSCSGYGSVTPTKKVRAPYARRVSRAHVCPVGATCTHAAVYACPVGATCSRAACSTCMFCRCAPRKIHPRLDALHC